VAPLFKKEPPMTHAGVMVATSPLTLSASNSRLTVSKTVSESAMKFWKILAV